MRNLNYWEFWLDGVEYILKGNFECLTRAMLEIQVQMEDKVSYSVMRKIHKLSVDCLKKTMKHDYIWIPREKRNEKRIVIMTEQLVGMRMHRHIWYWNMRMSCKQFLIMKYVYMDVIVI